MTGGIISYQGRNYALNHAFGSAAISADREMVAASTGFKHRLIGFVGNGQTSATFKSAATAISQALAATSQLTSFPINQHGYLETNSGEALNVVAVGGTLLWDIWYITIPSA